MDKPKHISLKANFEQIEEHNSSFLKAKLQVFAFGKNRNNSSISQESFELAKESIYTIPVVAKFTDNEDKYGNDGDLEGHNTYLTTDKNGNLTIKQDTFAIGFISPDANITYEEVNEGTEENPDIKTYVVAEPVYLWRRYEAVEKIQEWLDNGIPPKISMEIGDVEGYFSEEENCYVISSFRFEAVAALGSTIQPCFPMSQIEQYSHQTFEESFYEMLKELKFSMNQSASNEVDDINVPKEGGNNVDEILKMLQQYSLTLEDLSTKGINHEDYSLEELEAKVKEIASTFSWSSEQLEDELRRIIRQNVEIDNWGYECRTHYYVDHLPDEKVVLAYDYDDGYVVGFSYSVNGDVVTVNMSTEDRYKSEWAKMNVAPENDDNGSVLVMVPDEMMDYKLKVKEAELNKEFELSKEQLVAEHKLNYEKLESELNTLKEQYSTLEERANTLDAELVAKVKAEREDAETAIFEAFAHELTEAEMEPIKSKTSEMSLDDIEDRLYSLVGKKKAKFNLNGTKRISMGLTTDVGLNHDQSLVKDVWTEQKEKFSK